MPSNPSSNTWNRPQGPAPTITTSVWITSATKTRRAPSGATRVGVGGCVVVLAVGCQLPDQAFELLQAGLGSAHRQAVLATRIAAGLARIQPVLDSAGQEAVGDI